MKTTVVAVLLVVLCLSVTMAMVPMDAPDSPESRIWAVLVAGSNGWDNYRHQSDVCCAYHALHARGIPDNQTIVFMFDDIARSSNNKYKGKIFNDYSHEDVYAGVPKDYTGKHVTPTTFTKVISGVSPDAGSNKVLASNQNDRVFIFFDDHGGDGVLCFPNDDLEHDVLAATLKTMAAKKMFGKLVFYIEACEAGSMFYDLTLPDNVYVVTASPIASSSYAWQYDDDLDVYLADVMAQSWTNQTATAGPKGFTFQEGYDYLTTHIDNGSQPCQYGDLSIASEININDFFGVRKSGDNGRMTVGRSQRIKAGPHTGAVKARDVSYETAKRRVAKNPSVENIAKLKHEELVRVQVDNALHNILLASGVNGGASDVVPPCTTCDESCKCMSDCGSSDTCKFECCNAESCHNRPSLSQNGRVCAKTLVRAWQKSCGNSHDYLRTGDNVLSRACRLPTGDSINVAAALQAIHTACPLII